MAFQETPVFIPVDFMQEFLQESFAQVGCSLEESERVTRRLIGANLRGHESHGVARMPRLRGMGAKRDPDSESENPPDPGE